MAKQTAGWAENILLQPGNIQLKAKLDTGAETSSLHCGDCRQYTNQQGQSWLSFTIADTSGKQHKLEKEIQRTARIKRHSGSVQPRPVIILGVCLANVYREIEFTMVSREGFNYPVLIGRNFLAGDFLVDSAYTYTSQPSCAQ